jgi:peptidylprolyl isomerase
MEGPWIASRRPQVLLAPLGALLLLIGCGSDSHSIEHSKSTRAAFTRPKPRLSCGPPTRSMRFTGRPGAKDPGEPNIRPPCGPPPKAIVVRDLKKGSGRTAAFGDEIALRYVGADYRSGLESYGSWLRPAISIELGAKTRTPGLEAGLRGMKVGGRRELVVPTALSEGHGALVYIVDLVKVEPG